MFVYPWEVFATFKYSAASLANQPQVCSCSAVKPTQQWVPASESTNLFLTLPPSPKHLASQRAGQPLKQQKMAWTGSLWITGKQRLAQRRRHQEQKRNSTDSSISKLESNHCNIFTILKNQTKKRHFYIYLR